jgi:hypothetical protein
MAVRRLHGTFSISEAKKKGGILRIAQPFMAGLASNPAIATKESLLAQMPRFLISSPRSNSPPEPEHFGQPIFYDTRRLASLDAICERLFHSYLSCGTQL